MDICKSLSFFLFLFLLGCGKSIPTLEGIDVDKWSNDKYGCHGVRQDMRVAIESQKDKLLALNQMEIIRLLGRPDQNELSTRNQKFFYYYIEPGPSCDSATDRLAERLAIRFNAVGLAKEVAVIRGE